MYPDVVLRLFGVHPLALLDSSIAAKFLLLEHPISSPL